MLYCMTIIRSRLSCGHVFVITYTPMSTILQLSCTTNVLDTYTTTRQLHWGLSAFPVWGILLPVETSVIVLMHYWQRGTEHYIIHLTIPKHN